MDRRWMDRRGVSAEFGRVASSSNADAEIVVDLTYPTYYPGSGFWCITVRRSSHESAASVNAFSNG